MTYTKNVLLIAGSVFLAGSVFAADMPKPKITMDQARVMAQKYAKGTVAKEEYEEEDGTWRYSFDFREGERIHEIGVSASDGSILENAWEDEDEDEDGDAD